MKKVGLVTYYGDNYGACLQAYALSNVIEQYDCCCEIIDINIEQKQEQHKKCFFQLIRKLMAILKARNSYKRALLGPKVRNSNRIRNISFDIFRKEYLKIKTNNCRQEKEFYDNPPLYDVYVCGSDQIWNPTFGERCEPLYFLDFCPTGSQKIAYAPSVGVSQLEKKYQDEFSKLLKNFDAISVRENNTVDLLENLCDKEIVNVLDPTLLLHSEYDVLISKSNVQFKDYIFCYLFGEEPYIAQVKDKIKKITGLKVISIPFVEREYFADDILVDDGGPNEFLCLIKYAKLVVTDSFHATAFSINFNVPFISLLRQSEKNKSEMSSRLRSLLSQVDLEERLVKPGDSLPHNLINMDFGKANNKLNELRKKSRDFLDKSLNKR